MSLQRGNNKVVFFYCKAAKIQYDAVARIVEKLCIEFEPFLIKYIKAYVDEHDFDSDVGQEMQYYMALTGHSMATKAAFWQSEPNAQLDLMHDGLDTPQAKSLINKPLIAEAFTSIMLWILAHLAVFEDSLTYIVPGSV